MQGDDLVVFEDKKFPLPCPRLQQNEKVDVVIRPEHLDIVPRAEGMLKGVVKSQLFKGMHYDTVVETRVGTTITVKMQVSQDRPVLNADAGEKISASAFLIDVEDVGELDDAKVVALASAEAWDVETEGPSPSRTSNTTSSPRSAATLSPSPPPPERPSRSRPRSWRRTAWRARSIRKRSTR